MARLASDARAGFFPVHPEALPPILTRLKPPEKDWSLLDPCCGKGAAVAQIATELRCPRVYASELDAGRAEEARLNLASVDATVVGPVSFLTMKMTPKAWSMAWMNPPYTEGEMGGGDRVEVHFLLRTTAVLQAGGIMVALVPERLMQDTRWTRPEFLQLFTQNYRQILCCPLSPSEHRHYNEVVVFGIRKNDLLDTRESPVQYANLDDGFLPTYQIPPTQWIRCFEKVEPTDQEIEAMLAASPLNHLFDEPREVAQRRPPLALGPSHVALMLASGQLDGYVDSDDPHVVRGVAFKEDYHKERREQMDAQQNLTTIDVFSERLKVKVRTVNRAGEIEDHT